MLTTVAIPVLNGASVLEQTLAAVRAQCVDGELELLVCDSGSSDGSVAMARRFGAEVIQIDRSQFGHGRTRNLLMERAQGTRVALLTQDAVPDGDSWLGELLSAFDLGDDAGLAFGPYRARPGASPMVARELTEWFAHLAPDGRPRVDRLEPAERELPPRDLLGPRGFFTDANACLARSAWEQVPFRDVPYAEDHVLAHDMMRAGFAKVFMPGAAVIHSHDYSTLGWARRSFDEARAIRDVYGWSESTGMRTASLNVYGRVGADWRWARADGLPVARAGGLLARSTIHHGARALGAILGARQNRLPSGLVERLSSERRGR